jgi:hypothetical protein
MDVLKKKNNNPNIFENPKLSLNFPINYVLYLYDIENLSKLIIVVNNMIENNEVIYTINRILNVYWYLNFDKIKNFDDKIIDLYISLAEKYWFKNMKINKTLIKPEIVKIFNNLINILKNKKTNFKPNKFIKRSLYDFINKN